MHKSRQFIINWTVVLIAIGLVVVAFAAYDFFNRDIVPMNSYPKGNAILVRRYRLYPNNYTVVVYRNGQVKKAKREDHYTQNMEEKEKFKTVHKLTSSEKTEIISLINDLHNYRVMDGNTDSKGVEILPSLEAQELKDAGEYSQEMVDKIVEFLERVS